MSTVARYHALLATLLFSCEIVRKVEQNDQTEFETPIRNSWISLALSLYMVYNILQTIVYVF